MTRRTYHGRGGCAPAFTLIELLVVVAIIAILISILLPALSRAKAQARTVACQSNIRNLSLAVLMYTDENNGWFPEWGFGHGGGEARKTLSWISKMAASYGNQQEILRCPDDRSPYWPPAGTLDDPNDTTKYRHTSYATNYYVVTGGIDSPLYPQSYNRLDRIRQPVNTIFFVELAEQGAGEYAFADHVHPDQWDTFYPEEKAHAAEQVMLARHMDKANYGFLDGHAEVLAFEKTYAIDDPYGGENGLPLWRHNKYNPTVAR